ncbi:MAG: hypothetical protein ABW034_09205 [Steroidobacteraceae bacterium]
MARATTFASVMMMLVLGPMSAQAQSPEPAPSAEQPPSAEPTPSPEIEGEVLDSVSSEQLAAMSTSRGSLSASAADPAHPVSWKELDSLFTVIGKRLHWRLDNARVPEAQWRDCAAIGPTPAKDPERKE